MRRMISQKLQDTIKNLSVATWADNDGNLEVGKNLTVDGNITCNGYIEDADGNNYISDNQKKGLFRHTVLWNSTSAATGNKIFVSFELINDTNVKLDSLLDIATALYTAPHGIVSASGIYVIGSNQYPVTAVYAQGTTGDMVGIRYVINNNLAQVRDTTTQANITVTDNVIAIGEIL